LNCEIKNGELRICILPLASWLREAILSFASQLKNLSFYEDKIKSKLLEIHEIVSWIEVEEKKYNVLYLKLTNVPAEFTQLKL